jgi:hypothetical protein
MADPTGTWWRVLRHSSGVTDHVSDDDARAVIVHALLLHFPPDARYPGTRGKLMGAAEATTAAGAILEKFLWLGAQGDLDQYVAVSPPAPPAEPLVSALTEAAGMAEAEVACRHLVEQVVAYARDHPAAVERGADTD